MQEKNVGQTEGASVPRRGRPRGSKSRRMSVEREVSVGRPRSAAIQRRWQREWIKPQFRISRTEASEIFFKYLRSAKGKTALKDIIEKGSPGIGKLNDTQLGKYLEETNLLSRYPHEVLVQD